jgi:hypothetical protein
MAIIAPQAGRRSAVFLALGSALALGGCASIMNGTSQQLTVEARHDGAAVQQASCFLQNSMGSWMVQTPGKVTVHRAYGDLTVKCEKPGIDPGVQTVKSSTKGMTLGNILVGGMIGAAIDAGDGAAYDYPSRIVVNMGMMNQTIVPAAVSAAAQPASGSAVAPAQAPLASLAPAPAPAPSYQEASRGTLERRVHAGQWTLLAWHARMDKNCQGHAAPAIELNNFPAHGTVEMRNGPFKIESGAEGSSSCTGKTVDGVGIYFKPSENFQGQDTVMYRVDGSSFTRDMTINVTVD